MKKVQCVGLILLLLMLVGCFPARTVSELVDESRYEHTVERYSPMPFNRSRDYILSKYERCYREPNKVGVILTLNTSRIYLEEHETSLQIVRDIRRHAYTTERTILAVAMVKPDGDGTAVRVIGTNRAQVNGLSKFVLNIINNHGIGMC